MLVPDLEVALADKRERLAPGPRSIADLARALPAWAATHYHTYKRRGAALAHADEIAEALVRGESPADALRLRQIVKHCEVCAWTGEVASGLGPDGAVMDDCPACVMRP